MRRTINLILALSLTFGGAGALIYLAFFAAGWKVWMVVASVFVASLGARWLWSDFIDATPNEDA